MVSEVIDNIYFWQSKSTWMKSAPNTLWGTNVMIHPIHTAKHFLSGSSTLKLKVFHLGWEIEMAISILGIDIAKNNFQCQGDDDAGNTVLKRRLPRRELAAPVANLPQLKKILFYSIKESV